MIMLEKTSGIDIGLQTKGASLLILREIAHLKALTATPHITAPVHSVTIMTTNTARIRCPGCNKAFTPRGLSQHSSKSLDARCRGDCITLETPIPYVLRTAFSPETDHPNPFQSLGGAQQPSGRFAVTFYMLLSRSHTLFQITMLLMRHLMMPPMSRMQAPPMLWMQMLPMLQMQALTMSRMLMLLRS